MIVLMLVPASLRRRSHPRDKKIGRFVAFGYGDRQCRPMAGSLTWAGAGSAGMGFDVKFADLLREFVEWALNRCVADDIGDR